MPGKYLSMAKFIALEEQGNVEVFRQGVRDADARIEARRWMHAFAVAHVDGLGGASLMGIRDWATSPARSRPP